MRPDAIRELLWRRPFRSFRVYVSDRAIYDVAHPEAARTQAMLLIIDIRPAGFAGAPGRQTAYISLIQVTRVEVYFPGDAPAP